MRQAAAAEDKSLTDNARAFALLNMAIMDGLIAVMDTKYTYTFWRPETAIRAGHTDGNPFTLPDPAWTPFIATPCHPSYPSAHATLAGGAREVAERIFGTQRPLDHAVHRRRPWRRPPLHAVQGHRARHRRRAHLRRHPLPLRPGAGRELGVASGRSSTATSCGRGIATTRRKTTSRPSTRRNNTRGPAVRIRSPGLSQRAQRN